jgi:Ca-activated chloride channel family protein
MASDRDLESALPDPLPPSEAARERAVAAALERFDQKNSRALQGSERVVRLKDQTASPPSSRRSLMPRLNYGIAASFLLLLLVGSFAWISLNHTGFWPRTTVPTGLPSPVPPAETGVADSKLKVAQLQTPEPAPPPAQPELEAKPDMDAARAGAGQLRDQARNQPVGGRLSASTPAAVAVGSVDVAPPAEPVGRDKFANQPENGFKVVQADPVSTFSIDVDTASYAFVRASLDRNLLPQPDAVRTEELINYFPYRYDAPATAEEPFKANVAVFPNPWAEGRKLIRIGIKGYALQPAARPRANLVFLIDTSGSMDGPNRLPLLKQSLAMLLGEARPGRPRRHRLLCRRGRHRARADRGAREVPHPRRDRTARRRRQHGRGRRHPRRPMRWPSRISTRRASTA